MSAVVRRFEDDLIRVVRRPPKSTDIAVRGPSKLVMRVRFPSPALATAPGFIDIFDSHCSDDGRSTPRQPRERFHDRAQTSLTPRQPRGRSQVEAANRRHSPDANVQVTARSVAPEASRAGARRNRRGSKHAQREDIVGTKSWCCTPASST
jgi:hypothetical protein